ncbi:MAG: hypothetical protein HQM11_00935 [SAR324 cluster bacterium]|nr:hypothetical protein [SAR324 cluster bacterium]
MIALREIIDLENLRGIINIPKDFHYSKVELVVLPVEENQPSQTVSKQFDPEKFYGVTHFDKIDEKILEMREEWERE